MVAERRFRPRLVVDHDRDSHDLGRKADILRNNGMNAAEMNLLQQSENQAAVDSNLEMAAVRMTPEDYRTMCASLAEKSRAYYDNVMYKDGKMPLPDGLPAYLAAAEPEQILEFAKSVHQRSMENSESAKQRAAS